MSKSKTYGSDKIIEISQFLKRRNEKNYFFRNDVMFPKVFRKSQFTSFQINIQLREICS
jgi:hypothetical protein